MLPEYVTQLLSAFVDGELGQRQRNEAMRLLHQSSEARELLRQLQENAHRVKQLPPRKVEPSLVDDILEAIAAAKMQPAQPVQPRLARRRWKPYVAASLAASVLMGAIGVAYWKSMVTREGVNHRDGIATAPDKKPEPRPLPEPEPAPRKLANPMLAVIDETFRGFGAPIVEEKIFTASFGELRGEGPQSARLQYELGRNKTMQLDVTVKNNALAIERLRDALFEQGIKIVVDPDAQKSLNKKAKVEYLVYADNLTTDEVTKILQGLSLPDKSKKVSSVPTPFEKLKVAPASKSEKEKVGGILGIDLGKEPKSAVAGKIPKRLERVAVVLPVSAGARPSQEVRQVGEKRLQPQAGALQLLIKIRQE